MVTTVTTLGRNGVQDSLIQKITAIIIGVYILWFLNAVFSTNSFQAWKAFFEQPCTMYFSLLFLLSVVFHAWIGIWTVTTDYLKPLFLRLTTQLIVFLFLGYYLFWGIKILWRL